MNLLHVDSSILGDHSVSRKISAAAVAALRAATPDARVTYRDLDAAPAPHQSGALLAARATPAEARTPEQARDVAEADAILEEFLAADVVVLGVPMYNFGIPAQLKSWLDAIARAQVTFRYTEQGPQGLLTGKQVYAVMTRGGIYRNTPNDSQTPFLATILGFLGMTEVQFLYAEGLAMGAEAEQQALDAAERQIAELVAA